MTRSNALMRATALGTALATLLPSLVTARELTPAEFQRQAGGAVPPGGYAAPAAEGPMQALEALGNQLADDIAFAPAQAETLTQRAIMRLPSIGYPVSGDGAAYLRDRAQMALAPGGGAAGGAAIGNAAMPGSPSGSTGGVTATGTGGLGSLGTPLLLGIGGLLVGGGALALAAGGDSSNHNPSGGGDNPGGGGDNPGQPPPPPPEPDLSAYRTIEYELGSLDSINAAYAYSRGLTGAGVRVVVAGTGVDDRAAEMNGKVSNLFAPSAYFPDIKDGDNIPLPYPEDIVINHIPAVPETRDPTTGAITAPAQPERNEYTITWGDHYSHETAVAGIIAGTKDGNASRPHGVAYDAEIVPLRISSSSGVIKSLNATTAFAIVSQFIEDERNAGRDPNIRVFNASFGGSDNILPDPGLVRRMINNGVVLVASTGNVGPEQPDWQPNAAFNATPGAVVAAEGDETSVPDFPAALPTLTGFSDLAKGTLAVSSINKDKQISSFANPCGVAAQWCVVAPGEGLILSAAVGEIDGIMPAVPPDTSTPEYDLPNGNGLFVGAGTSYAAAYVSGVMALLFQQSPGLTPEQATNIIKQTATDLGDPGVDAVYGWGPW